MIFEHFAVLVDPGPGPAGPGPGSGSCAKFGAQGSGPDPPKLKNTPNNFPFTNKSAYLQVIQPIY